jgi:proline racemase
MCPPGSLDRSPCGTGTSARVALLHTRGELDVGEERRFEGPLGTFFSGAVASSDRQGELLYVRPRVSGRAYLTGFHQFVLEQDDPLPGGFRIGPKPRNVPAPTA